MIKKVFSGPVAIFILLLLLFFSLRMISSASMNVEQFQQLYYLLLAVNLPYGDDGTEFGGIDTGVSDDPLSVGASLFAQLAWYF